MMDKNEDLKCNAISVSTGISILDIFYDGRLLEEKKAQKVSSKKINLKHFFEKKKVR